MSRSHWIMADQELSAQTAGGSMKLRLSADKMDSLMPRRPQRLVR